MAQKLVSVGLNQQQLELIDNTLARGVAADRSALLRRALTEYAAKHLPASKRTDKVTSRNKETL